MDRFDVLSLQSGDTEDMRRFREYLATPQSWNRYMYAKGNPLLYVDPNGEEATAAVGAGTWFFGQGGAGAGFLAGAAGPTAGVATGGVVLIAGVGLGYAVNQIPGVSEHLTFQPVSNAIANVFFATQADSARNLINAKVTTVLMHISSYSSPGGPNEPDDRSRKKNIYERMKKHLEQARDKLKRLKGKQKDDYARKIKDAAEKLEKWWQAE